MVGPALRTVPFSDLQPSVCVVAHTIVDTPTYIACLARVSWVNTNQLFSIRETFIGEASMFANMFQEAFAMALDRW